MQWGKLDIIFNSVKAVHYWNESYGKKKQMFLQLASCGYDIYFVYVTKWLVLLCVYTKGTHRITPRNCNDPCSHNTKTHLYVIFIAIEVSRSNI